MDTEPPPPLRTDERPADFVEYAGFWRRFVAALIDGFLTGMVTLVPALIFGVIARSMRDGKDDFTPLGWVFLGLAVVCYIVGPVIVGWLYEAKMLSSPRQATLGKRAMGIKVTDMDGNRLTFAIATGRHFSKIISFFTLYIGFIMAAFTERKQALHDLIMKTLVVKQ